MSRRLRRRVPLVVWLIAVWVLLWGSLSPKIVLSGVLVAAVVTLVFPMPPASSTLALRPLRFSRLVGYLAWDLVISTLRVSWQAVRYGRSTRAGIVAVRTKTDSDYLTAVLANALSLAPGKSALQIDRANRLCYVYALGFGDGDVSADVERVRRDVARLEEHVVRAIGSDREIALVDGEV
jgi:multicomponent Na+:H+ antiporter subunit E